MKVWNRSLAALLCLIMVLGMLPVLTSAAEAAEPAAEVIYNLRDLAVTVGSDESRLEDPDLVYDLFDEDGNYVLYLEPDAFFPYEVQFTCNGVTESRWFETPEDTEVVGGHTFSVSSMSTGAAVPVQMGLTVNGVYVPVYPEPKEFTPYPQISTLSLLPLEEPLGETYTVDLTGFFWSELTNVGLDVLLPEGATEELVFSLASEYSNDRYYVASNGVVSFPQLLGNVDPFSYAIDEIVDFDLIVGPADQLNTENTRYQLRVQFPEAREQFAIQALDADRQPVEVRALDVYSSGLVDGSVSEVTFLMLLAKNACEYDENLTVSMDFADTVNTEGLTVEIFEGNEDLTSQLWQADLTQADGGYTMEWWGSDPRKHITIQRNGNVVIDEDFFLAADYDSTYVDNFGELCQATDYGRIYVPWSWSRQGSSVIVELRNGYPADGQYYYSTHAYNSGDTTDNGLSLIEKAVVGVYETLEAAADAEDIKEKLFGEAWYDGGYLADYSQGVTFTIFAKDGDVLQRTIKTVAYEGETDEDLPYEGEPLSADTYFRMNGAQGYDSWVMPYEDDSYYYNGYQTVFVMDQDEEGNPVPVTAETLKPRFYTGSKVHVYAGHDGQSGTAQESGNTEVTFTSGQPVQYSAAAENGTHLKNYWVTFVTQQEGASLFVNGATNSAHKDEESGLPVREIFLTPEYDYKHDIFFANVGDEQLTGLYVKLEDAQNIRLDTYWTIGDTTTLAPLSTVEQTSYYGELWNVGKIRLVSTATTGDISGKLTIGSANGGEVTMLLTGISGTPEITTTEIVDGVKYVPYSSVIQTNSMYAADSISFELVEGELPDGVELRPDGELYGVPQEIGEFEFCVEMDYKGEYADSAVYTLTITENSDSNVWESTDSGYEVTIPVGEEDTTQGEHAYVLTEYADQVFESQGEFAYFVDFWLDGEKLTDGVDYLAEEGSTKITIYAETFREAGTGSHTIAAEFREGGTEDGALKRAAQNYIMEEKSSAPVTPPSGGTPNPAPVVPTTGMPFYDVYQSAWYFHDVKWAYENGWMIGVSGSRFAPNEAVSQATIVTVLARMAEVDLTEYAENPYPSIPDGKWYTASAVWALENKLLPTAEFGGEGPIGRDHMAIMLVKYLKHLDVQVKRPANPMEFADGDQMSKEAEEAFQILHACGVLKGVGENRMEPASATTRAQFSALINRIDHLFDAE